jgi:hypothetical protein
MAETAILPFAVLALAKFHHLKNELFSATAVRGRF